MYSDYALIKKSTLIETCDSIRERTGNSDLIDPADFASKIREIEGGEGSSVPGGYTVNFYDTDNILIESHSTKYGNAVGAPLSYVPVLWQDESNNRIILPLTITEDMGSTMVNLYAGDGTYADKLYTTFNIDPEEYPVVFIKQSIQSNEYKGACAIYFTKGISKNSTSQINITSPIRGNIYAYTTSTDTKTVVDAVCNLINEEGFELKTVSATNSTLDHNFYINTSDKLDVESGKWYDLNLAYGDSTIELLVL